MQSQLEITVLSGTSAGDVFRFRLESGRSVTIGRATESDIVLQDPKVSRRHAKIELGSKGYSIADLGSTHGTFHMGFHLKPGDGDARRLASGDEFKIADLLFRAEFDETPFQEKKLEKVSMADAKTIGGSKIPPVLRPWLHGRRGLMIGAIALLLLVLLFLPSGGEGGIQQRSNEVISVPAYRVIGYFGARARGASETKDGAHYDKAIFDIPASDVLIEYEAYAESPVSVKLDETTIEEIKPVEGLWRQRQLIVRGLAIGRERRLIFDNLAPGVVPGQNSRQWGIRDLRAAPLSSLPGLEGGFLPNLNYAIGLVEGIDKEQSGLFSLVRAMQVAAVELLKEQKLDGVGLDVDVSGESVVKATDLFDIRQRLEAIRNSYEATGTSPEQSIRNLAALTKIIGDLDAELWRRVFSRINQAQIAAKVKRHIDAHDLLISGEQMFPGGEDYRWNLAHRLLMNDKVIPKRIREHPQDYRK